MNPKSWLGFVRPALSSACALIVELAQFALRAEAAEMGVDLAVAFGRQRLAEILHRIALRSELERSLDDVLLQSTHPATTG